MKTPKSAETLRKIKFLLFLPLLICPFVTMAFWSMGGGKTASKPAQPIQKGFNPQLPKAKFDEQQKNDKWSAYAALAKEKLELKSETNSFGYFDSTTNNNQASVTEIEAKIAKLNSVINQPAPELPSYTKPVAKKNNLGNDVDRLEYLMANMKDGGSDPEMQQVDAVLEKIKDIQNPGRVRERHEKQKNLSGGYMVHKINARNNQPNESFNSSLPHSNIIKVTIHQNQEVVSGSVVKLRLLDSIIVNGIVIPKNQFIYGIASIDDERLQISLKSLRYKDFIFPISLSAFDLDGLQGLYIPGSINRDASKKGVDDAIQNLQIMTMDPSLSAQAATAGVQAAKGLFSKKVKQVRVKLKAGYQLLLKDNNQKN
ncbi:MAG TPA: conjugative transposon protein TraM [Pelobium sp.]|nr:conjugative transposon protein TraM [Pelobium sp.]